MSAEDRAVPVERDPIVATARVARPGGVDVWERWMPAWHVYNAAVLVGSTAWALVDRPVGPHELAVVAATVAALVIVYWIVWIRVTLWRCRPAARIAYGVFLLAAFAVLLHVAPGFAFLQFALYAQLFFSMPPLAAVGAGLSVGVILALDVFLAAGGDIGAALPEMAIDFVQAAAFTMLSAWIGAIIGQSDERQTLLDQLAATRAELATAEREAGMLEERARLSREIHDTLAQGFASVVTHLEAADASLVTQPARARDHVLAAEEVARASLDEARGLVWALRPSALADGGLPAALERAASAAADAGGPAVDMTISGIPRPLHPDVEITILRAAQEALANARRHSAARRTTLTLTYFDDEVSLDVSDDGCGFDPAAVSAPGPAGGHGLRGMRERAQLLGGSLEIESAPGEGTAIALALPAVALPAGAAPSPAPPAGAAPSPAPPAGAAPDVRA